MMVLVKVIRVFLDLCFPHDADIMEKDITKKGAAPTPRERPLQVVGNRKVSADDIGPYLACFRGPFIYKGADFNRLF